MSAAIKLKATAGGSVSLQVDDTLTTDETFNVSEGGIESGSNANGNWTKFPDGTLICHGKDIGTAICSGVSGNVYYSRDTVTFPISFIDDNISISCSAQAASGSYGVAWASGRVIDVNSFHLDSMAAHSASTVVDRSYQAIGRWKA